MTPHVTCVCLTADRQAYTDRAVKCFLQQTYPNKSLLIWDTGKVPYFFEQRTGGGDIYVPRNEPMTIGAMRNLANDLASEVETDIIAHWDSDDYSHPLRLAWQVAELKNSRARAIAQNGKELLAVGYRTMLFWRKPDETAWLFTHDNSGYGLGTSLMYWRSTWETRPFKELNIGEDLDWLREQVGYEYSYGADGFFHLEPAMVAEIHESNTTIQDFTASSWKRVPEWDERLKGLMKL